MKNAIKAISMVLCGVVTLVICITMYGRETRQKEIQNSLHNAVEQTVSVAKVTKKYAINNNNEFVADFVEDLVSNITTDSDCEVKVYGADVEKGLLAANVTENYKHPTGADGKVEHERTVIYDKKEEVDEMHTVKFYLDSADTECYMLFNVKNGDRINTPVEPKEKDKTFLNWQDGNGYLADFTQPVEQDMIYYALWR